VVYKREILPGPQPALLSRDLFDAVQRELASQLNNHSKSQAKSDAPLRGKIFDDRGTLMGPSHTRKKGRKYRYYISSCLLQGRKELAGSIHRVPASTIEATIVAALRKHINASSDQDDNDLIRRWVDRVDVHTDKLVVTVKRRADSRTHPKIRIAWKKPPWKKKREDPSAVGACEQSSSSAHPQ
jgi:hypothetical protein